MKRQDSEELVLQVLCEYCEVEIGVYESHCERYILFNVLVGI